MSEINQWVWKEITAEEKNKIIRRSQADIDKGIERAGEILASVRKDGDTALRRWSLELDKADLTSFRVPKEEWAKAGETLEPKVKKAIEFSAENIKKFHKKQMPEPIWWMETKPGLEVGEKTTPIEDAALYVPRGKGSFPSVMLMLGIPASVAGVERIGVFTPPGPDGTADPATLYAAHLSGAHELYKVGGAQAIGALGYGTKSIRKFHKVIGPGNPYVSAAKRLLYGILDIGLPAGPSESIILADEYADPEIVAADLLIEAEHGPDSMALLISHDSKLIDTTIPLIKKNLEALPARRKEFCEKVLSNYGGVIKTDSLEESIEAVNMIAPEHLEVLVENPKNILNSLKHAGEILLGSQTPITFCNYLLGPNAILPTGGFAKTNSCVSVFDFLKRSSIGYVKDAAAFQMCEDHAIRLAEFEGFPAHAQAVKIRKTSFNT